MNIYLDLILSQSTDYPLEQIRFVKNIFSFPSEKFFSKIFSSKLQAFLITSNSYRVQSIFNRINPISYLRREVALLYGKVQRSVIPSRTGRMFDFYVDESIRTSFSNTRR